MRCHVNGQNTLKSGCYCQTINQSPRRCTNHSKICQFSVLSHHENDNCRRCGRMCLNVRACVFVGRDEFKLDGCTRGVHGNVLSWDDHQRKNSCAEQNAEQNGRVLLLYVNTKNLKLRKLVSSINDTVFIEYLPHAVLRRYLVRGNSCGGNVVMTSIHTSELNVCKLYFEKFTPQYIHKPLQSSFYSRSRVFS